MLPGASLSNALRMGKHTVLEIFEFGKKHSSAGAVFQRHSWASAGKREITIVGFEGTPAITSHHDITMKAHQSGKRKVLQLPAETSQA